MKIKHHQIKKMIKVEVGVEAEVEVMQKKRIKEIKIRRKKKKI